MATYVNDLRLKEIATGDESGTWGTSTNTNLELIGEALGYATQQVFSSDADATTTVADGASDPARAMYYKITSAASLTATRTLTIAPNTISRVMFIENATSGSQSIAISQGSGANVTIAAGKTAVVYLDGAGSGASVVDAMAGVDPGVTDTLAEVLTAGNTSGGTDIVMSAGDNITNASGDLTLDIAGDIILDAGGSEIRLSKAGTEFGKFATDIGTPSGFAISSSVLDGDIDFQGNDGGSTITALTLDMSEAGAATFNAGATFGSGIDVTGSVTADGLTVDGDASISSANARLRLFETDTTDLNTQLQNQAGDFFIKTIPDDASTSTNRFAIDHSTGDISFYNDAAAQGLFWDSSESRLGLGTTSPNNRIDAVEAQGTVANVLANGTYVAKFTGDTTYTTGASQGILIGGVDGSLRGVALVAEAQSTLNDHDFIIAVSGTSATPTERLRINSSGALVLNNSGGDAQMYFGGTSGTNRMYLARSGLDSLLWNVSNGVMRFGTNNAEAMRIDASGNLLVADTSALTTSTGIVPTFQIIGESAATGSMYISRDQNSASPAAIYGYKSRNSGATVLDNDSLFSIIVDGSDGVGPIAAGSIRFEVDGTPSTNNIPTAIVFERSDGAAGLTESMRIDASGNVGIGASSALASTYLSKAFVYTAGGANFAIGGSSNTNNAVLGRFTSYNIQNSNSSNESSANFYGVTSIESIVVTTDSNAEDDSGGSLLFKTKPEAGALTERMRIDASGNLLVGKTALNTNTAGLQLENDGYLSACRDGGNVVLVNRKSSDGALVTLQKDGTTVGSIACRSSGGNLQIHTDESGIDFGGGGYLPMRGATITDNSLDIGSSSFRYKDLYRSGSTISTSDRNMKQDERDLTEAETRVAQACKGLLKAFRFIDAVEVDGDDARIHFGIIAQDLQAAFEAEGLDATKYAMFRPSTFTDDEGNEQARLGVCYENLLAFIIAAI